MKRVKELVQIETDFQKSVNLALDINSKEKLSSYIPTYSSVQVLKQYLDNIVTNTGNRSTVLIGPYGKGKSHLLLILLSILCNKGDDKLVHLIERIAATDLATGQLAGAIAKKNKPYLPIIVNYTGGEVMQAFLLALHDALLQYNLEHLVPNSAYKEAVRIVENWETNYPISYEAFIKELKAHELTLTAFINKMQRMDSKTLQVFKEIYPRLTAGSIFHPLIQNNIIQLFQEVTHILCTKHGYSGIYIIFDEFSKFIEGHDGDGFAKDMKILQDLCELANKSKEEAIQITFVAHKSICSYQHIIKKEYLDAYKGVEGRMKEVMFVMTAQNNYELVKHAIHKVEPKYSKFLKSYSLAKTIFKASYELPCFKEVFQKSDFMDIVAMGCFPLTPIATYLLLRISEKIGQNERSIFTFIGNKEAYSLRSFLEAAEGDTYFCGADWIYDYFYLLFKEAEKETLVHKEWIKAEYALSKETKPLHRRIIKAISLIHMLNREELQAIPEVIYLSLGIEEMGFEDAIQDLIKNNILMVRSKKKVLTFKNHVGIDIEKELLTLTQQKYQKVNVPKVLKEVSELTYVLPKRHNQLYSMTRFFAYEFLEVSQFLKLSSGAVLFEEEFSDGKIIVLIRNQEVEDCIIEKHIKTWKDPRIVVIWPDKKFTYEKSLQYYQSIMHLLGNEAFLEDNKVLEQELHLYLEDVVYEINQKLEEQYLPWMMQCKVYTTCEQQGNLNIKKDFNRMLSQICQEYYNYAPKVNHELVNKQVLTTQIKKARMLLIDTFLKGNSVAEYYKGTSAPSTIFRAVFVRTGVIPISEDSQEVMMDFGTQKVLETIYSFIHSCEGQKRSLEVLYKELQGKTYGVRRGIIPLFLVYVVTRLQDMPIFYLNNVEMKLDAPLFDNMNKQPEKYYLLVECDSIRKGTYIQCLYNTFVQCKEGELPSKGIPNHTSNTLWDIVTAMQQWYRSLSQYATTTTDLLYQQLIPSEYQGYIQGLRKALAKLEVNPREFLFEQLMKICNTSDYECCYQRLLQTKKLLDSFLGEAKLCIYEQVKLLFEGKKEDNLGKCLQHWYSKQEQRANQHVLSVQTNELVKGIKSIHTFDEEKILDLVAKGITDLFVEDWSSDTYDTFMQQLQNSKLEVEELQVQDEECGGKQFVAFTDEQGIKVERYFESTEDDSTSFFLKNAIEDALDEFGDSLEMNQKVAVLVQALQELLK